MDDAEAFRLQRTLSMPLRLFLGAAGLFCILAPAIDLRAGFLQPGWWTLFVGTIVVGAWVAGGVFLAAAVIGETQRWDFRGGELALWRASLLWRTTEIIRGSDVEHTEIRVVEWDSRANSFSVVLRLKSGAEFETPDYDTRDTAEAMRGRINRALRLQP